MMFILKLIVVLLTFYMKLNSFQANPLIERNKTFNQNVMVTNPHTEPPTTTKATMTTTTTTATAVTTNSNNNNKGVVDGVYLGTTSDSGDGTTATATATTTNVADDFAAGDTHRPPDDAFYDNVINYQQQHNQNKQNVDSSSHQYVVVGFAVAGSSVNAATVSRDDNSNINQSNNNNNNNNSINGDNSEMPNNGNVNGLSGGSRSAIETAAGGGVGGDDDDNNNVTSAVRRMSQVDGQWQDISVKGAAAGYVVIEKTATTTTTNNINTTDSTVSSPTPAHSTLHPRPSTTTEASETTLLETEPENEYSEDYEDYATEEPPTDGGDEKEKQNMLNQSDVYNYLMRYESDGGNACLLDGFKDYLMWWSNANGTLKEWNFSFKVENMSSLDMSYNNITIDDTLYKLTKAQMCLEAGKQRVLVYSAAYNNLTMAPYRTLTLMNDTLQYLTLRGNQFACSTVEMQKETISRLLNDTSFHKDPDTNTTTNTREEKLSMDFTDYYGDEDYVEHINSDRQRRHAHKSQTNHKHSHNNNYNNNNNNNNNKQHTHNENHNENKNKKSEQSYHNKNEPDVIIGSKDDCKDKEELGLAWAKFPPMPALVELDISNCHIEYVGRDAFQNLTGLRRLYMAHNKMLTIPFDAFAYVPQLQYLDLSHTNVLEFNYLMPLPTLEAIFNLIYGVKVQQLAFKELHELVYLDMSHTKLTRNSAVAFTHLGEKLQFLSLCYTSFPMLGNVLFKNTNLMALDLSGNPYASSNIIDDAFEGVAQTLKYLYFENSNIKDISWLKYLANLKVLGLAGNNVNSVSLELFEPLRSLQILDMSSNHVGNWYNSAFAQNKELRVLNLRDNNINMLTSEMLKDFQPLEYLSLGVNNFVCDCMLVDLVEVATANDKDPDCSRNVLLDAQNIIDVNERVGASKLDNETERDEQRQTAGDGQIDGILNETEVDTLIWEHYLAKLKSNQQQSQTRSRDAGGGTQRLRIRYAMPPSPKPVTLMTVSTSSSSSTTETACPPSEPVRVENKLIDSSLHFQLLDYEEDSYWCFNETERMSFMDLNCQARSYTDMIVEKLEVLTTSLVSVLGAILVFSIVGVIAYCKRWHILYYYSSLKSAALLAVAAKDNVDKFNTLAERDPNLVYDIFISYCQNDRQWVLDELLPNVEESGDISICMHERDFQIGLTILDNIMSCMDRSRALMLIISTNFLLSHWCQFEMHLAQHRIFEVSKEQLILVFLEDIPRSKRPKSLQYLMDVKTYIKWPAAKGKRTTIKPEERKLFWRRLKHSLEQIEGRT